MVDDKVTGFLVDYTQLLVGAGAVWRVAVSFCHSLRFSFKYSRNRNDWAALLHHTTYTYMHHVGAPL